MKYTLQPEVVYTGHAGFFILVVFVCLFMFILLTDDLAFKRSKLPMFPVLMVGLMVICIAAGVSWSHVDQPENVKVVGRVVDFHGVESVSTSKARTVTRHIFVQVEVEGNRVVFPIAPGTSIPNYVYLYRN